MKVNKIYLKYCSDWLGGWLPLLFILCMAMNITIFSIDPRIFLVSIAVVKYSILDGVAMYKYGGFYYGERFLFAKQGWLNYLGLNLLFIGLAFIFYVTL